MATQPTGKSSSETKAPRAKKDPIALHTRIIDQLTKAALMKKVSSDDLVAIELHIGKLKSILA